MKDDSIRCEKRELVVDDGEQTLAYDPRTQRHEPVYDAREEMREVTEENPTSEEQKRAFYTNRRKLLEETDLSDEQKEHSSSLVEAALDRFDRDPPLPGGVGAGVWYRNGDLLFRDSTALYHYIVMPPRAGGDTNTWLYLTATNRAAKGVEAFASYFAQQNPEFKVFDWSRPDPDRWALTIPYDRLGRYLIDFTFGSLSLQTLYVINITRRTGGTSWVNEVLLHNGETGQRDLVYSYAYTLGSDGEQHWGGWAPIVETFQDDYGETNPLGFFETLLVQDGVERQLTESTTFIVDNKHGIRMFHRTPNHSFLAK